MLPPSLKIHHRTQIVIIRIAIVLTFYFLFIVPTLLNWFGYNCLLYEYVHILHM